MKIVINELHKLKNIKTGQLDYFSINEILDIIHKGFTGDWPPFDRSNWQDGLVGTDYRLADEDDSK